MSIEREIMDKTKKGQMLKFLNEVETNENYKEILKFFQGIPIICVAVKISVLSRADLREMITDLWKEKKIIINGADYNNLINSLLKNDRAFWFANLRLKQDG